MLGAICLTLGGVLTAWGEHPLLTGQDSHSLPRVPHPPSKYILFVFVLPILPVPHPFLYFFPPISFSEDDHEPSGDPSHLDQAISSSVDTKLVSLRFLPKKTQHTASTIQKLCVWIFTNCEKFELSSAR